MSKNPDKKDLQYLQDLLDEMATMSPTETRRFQICKRRAMRIIRKLKKNHPDSKVVVPNPDAEAVRRGLVSGFGDITA